MKHYLIALILTFALGTNAQAARSSQHHRSTAGQTVTKKNNSASDAKTAKDSSKQEGITVYSDTISDLTEANDSMQASGYSSVYVDQDEDFGPFNSVIEKLIGGTLGAGGILLAIVVVLVVFLFLLAPFILLALILRYLIKRHNQRIELAEKAMETGLPIPDNLIPLRRETAGDYRKKGIKNLAIGVGLVIMFAILDSELFMGIGALVACYGIGQVVISYTSNNKNEL